MRKKGGGGMDAPPPMQLSRVTQLFQVYMYFTKDKPKTDRGAVIESRCKQRKKWSKKHKEREERKTRAGRQVEKLWQ